MPSLTLALVPMEVVGVRARGHHPSGLFCSPQTVESAGRFTMFSIVRPSRSGSILAAVEHPLR